MKKVGSVIELNCSSHVGFAIILQENQDLKPSDLVAGGNISSPVFK